MNFIKKYYWQIGYGIGGGITFFATWKSLEHHSMYRNAPIPRFISSSIASVFWPLSVVGIIDFDEDAEDNPLGYK